MMDAVRRSRLPRALAILTVIVIAAITSPQASAASKKDRCPYYPSPVACHGERTPATDTHQSASYFRAKRPASHYRQK